jgi:allantoate deiminase
MLFLRSPGGLSHHPDESVLPEDVEAALATSLAFIELLKVDRKIEPTLQEPTEAHA